MYALTPQGAALGGKLARELGGRLFLPARLAGEHGADAFQALSPLLARTFHAFRAHLFIAAAGVAVRVTAPHLLGKDRDPAVVVMDQEGRYAVSLVSGHLGGANDLARRAAQASGGQAVITTATDTAGLPAMDVLAVERGLALGNLDAAKGVSAALLAEEPVQVLDPGHRLGLAESEHAGLFLFPGDEADWDPGLCGVVVTWRTTLPRGADPERTLLLHPPCLAAGLGCRRGAKGSEMAAFVRRTMARAGLALASLARLGSVDAKSGEPGLLELAETLGLEPVFFPARELDQVAAPNPSARVARYVGTASVSEAAALRLAGGGPLVLEKTASRTATLAVALMEDAC